LEFDTSKIGKIEFHPFNSSLALPPMAAVATSGNDFEESYPVQVGMNKHVVFKQPGYYYIPTVGGGASSGFGFVVTEPYFPLVTTPEELIDPMAYISTRDERKTLFQASNQKQALDDFWLKIQNQKDQARKLIRKYFENIEEANRLFTTHKAGWKTDKGMVMAIYGPPPLVYKNWDQEIWQYDKSMGVENSVFYFNRKNYVKDPNVWELKRFNEYDRVWYGVVELWRKGVINR
jgi:GWxTD domain-containing protein